MRALVPCTLALIVSLLACGGDDDPSCHDEGCAAGSAGQAGQAGSAGAGGSSLKAFLEACEQDAECATGTCFAFTSKGKHCSKPCQDDTACEAPSPGCNGMGYCRLPQ